MSSHERQARRSLGLQGSGAVKAEGRKETQPSAKGLIGDEVDEAEIYPYGSTNLRVRWIW